MEIIYWLIPLSIVILIGAIYLFFWAVKDGQFDDLESPAVSILFDDDLEINVKKHVLKDQNTENHSR
jgi:cbb3-type cytochrome oxidase maturation protein